MPSAACGEYAPRPGDCQSGSERSDSPIRRTPVIGHGAGVARAQQSLALHRLGRDDPPRCPRQFETIGASFTQSPNRRIGRGRSRPQPVHRPLGQAHISSRPSSVRAVSMMAGVISAMPRSLALSNKSALTIPRTKLGTRVSRSWRLRTSGDRSPLPAPHPQRTRPVCPW